MASLVPPRPPALPLLALGAGAAVYALAFAGDYGVFVLTRAALFAVAAVGLDLVAGLSGQLSLGHAAFLALGAYGGVLLERAGLPLPFAILGAALLAGAAGRAFAAAAVRLQGAYFALATLALQVGTEQLLAGATALTGGHRGLVVPALPISPRAFAASTAILCASVIAGALYLRASATGRAFIAVRDDDVAAAASGIAPARTRARAFTLAAALGGLAGALLAHLQEALHPTTFTLLDGFELLAMVILGGLGSLSGAAFGAALLVVLSATVPLFRDHHGLAVGALLLVVVLLEPRGIWGRLGALLAARRRPAEEAPR